MKQGEIGMVLSHFSASLSIFPSSLPICVSLSQLRGGGRRTGFFSWMDEENREKGGEISSSPPQSLKAVITGDLLHHQRGLLDGERRDELRSSY